MEINKASEAEIAAIRKIFSDYQAALCEPICFQNFEKELDGLLGLYASPTGAIFLAKESDTVVGCVAIRPFMKDEMPSSAVVELKRLYVYDNFKGMGIGKQLLEHALDEAKNLKYTTVMLETMDSMEIATGLYLRAGFKVAPPFYEPDDERVKFYQYTIK